MEGDDPGHRCVCCDPEKKTSPGYLIGMVSVILFLFVVFEAMIMVPQYEQSKNDKWMRKVWWFELVVFHTILLMFALCYFLSSATDAGSPGPEWTSASHANRYTRILKSSKASKRRCANQQSKFYGYYKPDRTHFCKQTNKLVLRMDHYCPWLDNTVGYWNYKYFFLTLFYGQWLTVAYCVFTFPTFLHATKSLDNLKVDFITMIAWFISAMLGGLLTWFFFFHCRLLANGYTTIEHCEKKRSQYDEDKREHYRTSPWDDGLINNIKESLGPQPLLWLLPTYAGWTRKGDKYYPDHCNLNHVLIKKGGAKVF